MFLFYRLFLKISNFCFLTFKNKLKILSSIWGNIKEKSLKKAFIGEYVCDITFSKAGIIVCQKFSFVLYT